MLWALVVSDYYKAVVRYPWSAVVWTMHQVSSERFQNPNVSHPPIMYTSIMFAI